MAPTLTEQLGTITAIVALALGIVQVLKLLLVKYKVGIVNSLPTPLICVGVSMGLTLLANLVFKTLPGSIPDLLWQAALAAGATSGLFTWLKKPFDSPADKSNKIPLALLLGLGLSMTGCVGMSNGQKYIIACQTYATTANTLAPLVRAGEFGTADKATIRVLNDTCKTIILKMRDDLLEGNTTFDFQYTLSQFQAVLDELLRMQLRAEAAKAKEISSGPDNPSIDRPDGGVEHGLAIGEGNLGVPADRPAADPTRTRRGDAGRDGRPREPGRRPERASPILASPAPSPAAIGFADYEFD